IERRPRGASQHKAAPTSVSGQSLLCLARATALSVPFNIEGCACCSSSISCHAPRVRAPMAQE
ncbi:hypothetical protein V0R39_26435, partial [Pseudomonas inefficax]|nr:hypothetical protein [Pseudomonas inefficax]